MPRMSRVYKFRDVAFADLDLDTFRAACRDAFQQQIDAVCAADRNEARDRQDALWFAAGADAEKLAAWRREMEAARGRLAEKRRKEGGRC
ncbi:MAG: hypothetical protein KGL39_33820 [Patescibacteria group bacterium]|nr:hypothetical protein [Patescibacteria group bacterium]